MKKLITLVSSLMLTLALLTACGQDAAPAGTGSAPASDAPSSVVEPVGDRADADIAWQYMTADETKAMLDAKEGIIVLDSRPDDMYNAGHIPGAYHVATFPVDTPELEQVLRDAVPNLQGEDPIVIVCKTGNKGAKRAISVLEEEGIAPERLFILEGGGEGWSFPEYTTTENDSVTPNA